MVRVDMKGLKKGSVLLSMLCLVEISQHTS